MSDFIERQLCKFNRAALCPRAELDPEERDCRSCVIAWMELGADRAWRLPPPKKKRVTCPYCGREFEVGA